MKVIASVLGIVGGIAGVIGAVFAFTVGGARVLLPGTSGLGIVGLSIVAGLAGLLGIIGGAIAIASPRTGGILMFVSAAVGLLSTFAAYFVGGVLLIIGGILALVAAGRESYPPAATSGYSGSGYGGTPGVQR